MLDWCLGGPPTESCTAIAQLYYRQGLVSFVLKPAVGLGCWVWGEDANHWDTLGCDLRDWEPRSDW